MNLTLSEVIIAVDFLCLGDRELLYERLRCQNLAQIEAEIEASRKREQTAIVDSLYGLRFPLSL